MQQKKGANMNRLENAHNAMLCNIMFTPGCLWEPGGYIGQPVGGALSQRTSLCDIPLQWSRQRRVSGIHGVRLNTSPL
uniref:Uncharacterized protein n=1 Tax=Anguilla anguilla TaxID=7936 RepID=A0A0E9XEL8_ANGAN